MQSTQTTTRSMASVLLTLDSVINLSQIPRTAKHSFRESLRDRRRRGAHVAPKCCEPTAPGSDLCTVHAARRDAKTT